MISIMKEKYLIDINLDGIFDGRDVDECDKFDFNIGVLTSKASFSCANLFPSMMKELGYMIIGQPSTLNQYTVNGETKWYPQKSVAFSIDNPNGANVSIAGCGGDISIYKYNPDNPAEQIQELYTMRSKSDGEQNKGRFFPYSSAGETNTESVVLPTDGNMTSSNFLYGHIFTLPRGNYVIGSSKKRGHGSAKLYYVCVQGQTHGDLGEIDIAKIGNSVHDVDFLLKDPTDINSPFDLDDASYFADFSFQGDFADMTGKMIIDTDIYDSEVYIRVRFNDFITYLLFYCRKNNPAFIVNSGPPIYDETLYSGPFTNYIVWGS